MGEESRTRPEGCAMGGPRRLRLRPDGQVGGWDKRPPHGSWNRSEIRSSEIRDCELCAERESKPRLSSEMHAPSFESSSNVTESLRGRAWGKLTTEGGGDTRLHGWGKPRTTSLSGTQPVAFGHPIYQTLTGGLTPPLWRISDIGYSGSPCSGRKRTAKGCSR